MRPSPLDVLVAGTLIGAPALAADVAMEIRLDAVIDSWVAAEKIVGAVVLVARDGEVVYERAAGYADREAGRAVDERTIFRLASLTKLVVSATAMALVDDGRLSLDDTVADWLPYFAPRLADGRRPDITIRQLMSHTSGLSYAFFEPGDDRYARANVKSGLERSEGTLEDNLRRLASVPLFYEPGTEWRYSLATDVLGGVIERVTGLPLPEAVARYVTKPLGMTDTAFVAVDPSRLAAAYLDGETRATRMKWEEDILPLGEGTPVSPARAVDPQAFPSGGAGMTGTGRDFLVLLETIRRGGAPLFGPDEAAALTTHAIGRLRAWTEGEGWGFGLGAAVLLDPCAAATPQHEGTWQWGGALGTHWFVDPVERLTVVVMTNTALAGVIGPFPAAIRDAVYGSAPDETQNACAE